MAKSGQKCKEVRERMRGRRKEGEQGRWDILFRPRDSLLKVGGTITNLLNGSSERYISPENRPFILSLSSSGIQIH